MIKNPTIHPVFQTIATMVLMGLIKKMLPWATLELEWLSKVAFVCLGLGILLGVLGGGKLERSNTTSDPLQVDQSRVLVTGGIYRLSRNPMYLGFVLILIAVALFLKNPLCLLVVPVFMFSITRLQIIPEERAMVQHFGQAYRDYQAKVRRWL